jgi:hypothetical protein
MKQYAFALLCVLAAAFSCGQTGNNNRHENAACQLAGDSDLINEEGITVEERFIVPAGYIRTAAGEDSFTAFLRKLPLKPHNTKVRLYNGQLKPNQDAHAAVIDMDPGTRDLQQCADAIIRLRAEYLYKKQAYESIHFNFTNGFRADYSKWVRGYRINVEGNHAYWVKLAAPSRTYDDFRRYLDIVFTYAGTLSLSGELAEKKYGDISAGDVLISGGSPGHAVIVADVAVSAETGARIYLLAQSFMPAQEIHILKNPQNPENPWYEADEEGIAIETPEWTFYPSDLKSFPEN